MIDPKSIMFEEGRRDALELAGRAKDMDGTAIIGEEEKIPAWREDAVYGAEHVGFPVRDKGQVYTILMPHTPAHNPGSRPENLRAIYSLLHTKDPAKAKAWMPSYGVSGLYKVDECCTYYTADGSIHVFRNLYDNNEYPPLTLNVEHRWEDLGEVSAWQ
jgi:hypothetical protein